MCQKGATSGTFSCNAPPRDPNPKPKALSPEIPHPKPTPSDTKVTEARVCEDHIKPWPRLSQTTLEKIHCPKNAQGHIPPALLLPLPSSPSFCNAAWRFLGTHSYEYTHPSIHASMHYVALRCITLHYHYITLHYITYINTYIHACIHVPADSSLHARRICAFISILNLYGPLVAYTMQCHMAHMILLVAVRSWPCTLHLLLC